jgi:hypothetical protein
LSRAVSDFWHGKVYNAPAVNLLEGVRERARQSAPGLRRELEGRLLSITPALRRADPHDLTGLTRAQLYDEARRLGVPGRSNMDRHELAAAIRRAQASGWSSSSVAERCRAAIGVASRSALALWALTSAAAGRVASSFQALPRRPLILSLIMLTAGGLGLVLAYAVAPQDDLGAPQVLRASRTLRIETVTGPGGTTTLVVTKTKKGEISRVPVEVLRTVTGPGGTVAVVVAGPSTTRTVRQIRQMTETQTRVVTQVQPVTQVVTNVVTQPETVVVTETVVVEVTTTVPGPP